MLFVPPFSIGSAEASGSQRCSLGIAYVFYGARSVHSGCEEEAESHPADSDLAPWFLSLNLRSEGK